MLRVIAICTAVALAISYAKAAPQESSSTNPAVSQYSQTLSRYCYTCHNEKLKTADLILSKMDLSNPAADPAVWEKVIRKLRTGQMPPSPAPRPEQSFYDSFSSYLENTLDRAAAGKPNPGRPTVHRLNRAEYANAVRDVLAVEVDGAALLPPDDAGRGGFDNVAEILSVSPLLVEKYLGAARKISRLAVGEPSVRPFTAAYDISRRLVQDDRTSEDLPFGSRGGTAVRHHFPADGEYVIKVRLQRNNDNYIRGLGEPHQLDVRLDGARIKLFTIGGEHKGRSGPVYTFINKDYKGDAEQEKYEFTADEGLEVRFPAKAGTHVIGVAFLKETYEPEGPLMPRQTYDDLLAYKGGDPAVDNVAVSGPYDTKGPGDTPSRRRIFTCTPGSSKSSGTTKLVSLTSADRPDAAEDACARKILSTLARRAYRRPLSDADFQSLMKFFRLGRAKGTFEAGITSGIQGMLVSPEFLFRIEQDPAVTSKIAPGAPYRVSDLELASRLSFFLWSSIPDEQLLEAAERGKLRDPAVLEQQVRRMLEDKRSTTLVDNFASQWLNLRKLASISPDPQAFPEFDDNLRSAFEKETLLFAESIARENRSVLDFLDADYTFLNERLARHYGVPNVYGSEFRRLTSTDDSRKGLLGQGSVLTVTSYANRTAPTLRGKWILENIFGAPPPPPPPNVPSLKEPNNGRVLTMRDRMEQHRANPACAVCHTRMDPLGFALENFDALGKWRTVEGTTPINSAGALPDGTKFEGPAELRRILLDRRELFVTTVTEKLLMYALGRGLDYYDQPTVRSIMRESAATNYRWSSLIAGIVKSAPFQMRRALESDK